MWRPDEDAAPHVEWVSSLREALRPHAAGGVYVNALGDGPGESVRRAYGSNWPRLVELKRALVPGQRVPPEREHRPVVGAKTVPLPPDSTSRRRSTSSSTDAIRSRLVVAAPSGASAPSLDGGRSFGRAHERGDAVEARSRGAVAHSAVRAGSAGVRSGSGSSTPGIAGSGAFTGSGAVTGRAPSRAPAARPSPTRPPRPGRAPRGRPRRRRPVATASSTGRRRSRGGR